MSPTLCPPSSAVVPVTGPRVGPSLPHWKRVLDLACCAFALPCVGLIALLLALWIALVARGPLLYRQERVGYRGRRFKLYKFRTMTVGADTGVHRAHVSTLLLGNRPMHKLDSAHDARLIAGGRLLRALGIDELPQLLNVLRGDMSIVGPRPCIGYEYEQYTEHQRQRLNAVPGLTGLWQVSGKNRTTFEQMVRLDLTYARTATLALDLKIIALTPLAVARQVADAFRRQTPWLLSSRRLGAAPGRTATIHT